MCCVINSVSPVHPMPLLFLSEWTYLHTFLMYYWQYGHLLSPTAIKNISGNPLSGGVKFMGMEKISYI